MEEVDTLGVLGKLEMILSIISCCFLILSFLSVEGISAFVCSVEDDGGVADDLNENCFNKWDNELLTR